MNPEDLLVGHLCALGIVIQIEWSLSITALLNSESGGRSIVGDFWRVCFGKNSRAASYILVEDIVLKLVTAIGCLNVCAEKGTNAVR